MENGFSVMLLKHENQRLRGTNGGVLPFTKWEMHWKLNFRAYNGRGQGAERNVCGLGGVWCKTGDSRCPHKQEEVSCLGHGRGKISLFLNIPITLVFHEVDLSSTFSCV